MRTSNELNFSRTALLSLVLSMGLGLFAAGCPDDDGDVVQGDTEGDDAGVKGAPEKDACDMNATKECTDSFGVKMCPVDSGFPGDGLRPCETDTSILLHYGPKNYKDKAEVEKYMLPANSEDENCTWVQTPNEDEVYTGEFHGRMRPYSHHMIVTMWDKLPDGVKLGEPIKCNQLEGVGSRWLLGSQDPQIDLARGGATAEAGLPKEGDPDYKLGTRLPAKQYLRIDMHYINSTDKPILREGWVKLEKVDKSDVKTSVDMITFFQGAINVPAGAKDVTTKVGKCVAPDDRYVALVTGHFHQNGTRFSVWHDTLDGDHKLIYETYDWENPGNAYYADRMKNPSPDSKVNQWGAESGYIKVKKGESISFQCAFDNPTDTKVALGETGSDQMCNVFGMYYPSNGDVWNCTCAGELCF